ncbi:hypothetical protein LOK49_LG13G00292 [Camellia lanceoleosa]|uniref:Uncharacterized protein n=1 Tax=Camellia lanceoleosa TaxID=1840588 RepID=A0ACC0FI83_9ERIC|nr:hypothetical protein LOK49_LG13G00292 [Camellia lanceoleosa]
MQAGQAATSVERQGMVTVMKVPSLDGNLETGFALVLDVACTTMLAGWNVTNAKLQGVKVAAGALKSFFEMEFAAFTPLKWEVEV